MSVELLLGIFIFRYLRKTLQTEKSFAQWDKILMIGLVASACLLAASVLAAKSRIIIDWLAHAVILYPVYLSLYKKEFAFVKPITYAILPFVLLSILGDLTKLVAPQFFSNWNDYYETAEVFAVIWMFAMWLLNRNQRKALEVEKKKTELKDREFQLSERLKAQLEIQVAERTAALTLQKEELQQALDDLKATQTQLIQSEKMASLGELTAGIAHEIQNPLNFVNNFSEVNAELVEEMKVHLQAGNMEEVAAIADDIAANEQKINHHGKRADAIVKGMLHHSRNSSGVKEPTDINALADEYLRLAYHGLRAKDKSFNANMKTEFDERIGSINIIPQDIGRVILNLITNAFYAVNERKKEMATGYEPTVTVITQKTNGYVEVKIKDNGNGIPQKVLDKIFQPFFTTKPTGQGTGLGLSMSYDIVTKGHGGELKVDTREGQGSEFTIELPVTPGV